MKRSWILFLVLSAWLNTAWASLSLPKNLGESDRKSVMEILGYGSQVRLLSSPVPLGGYQGYEFGLSTEYIPISDISSLGSHSNAKGEYNLLNLGFGKGLPYNVDLFLQFTPIPQSDGAFGYGGHVRWGFWETPRFPALLSLIVHGSGMNFNNLLATKTTGIDLTTTVMMEEVSLYFGGGPIRTIGSFVGSSNWGITSNNQVDETDLSNLHTVFGVSFSFEKLFLALEVDRVVQSTYAARLGFRY